MNTSPRKYRFVLFCALCSLLMASCSRGDSGGVVEPADAHIDVGDANRDSEDVEHVDTSPGDADLGADVDVAFNSDASDAGEAACECLDSRDECVGGRCVRAGVDCRVEPGACPESYDCDDASGNCVCTGETWETRPDECGPICEATSDCPDALMCDSDFSVCRQALTCKGNALCPGTQICVESADVRYCQLPGGGSVGEGCVHPGDCESGICEGGVCKDEACLDDNDCAPDEACTGELSVGTGTADGCTPRPEQCPSSCPEGTRCLSDECVRADLCRLSGDCESGDCVYGAQPANVGGCRGDENGETVLDCKPNEWRRIYPGAGELSQYCLLAKPCWSDANCNAPYICVGPDTGGTSERYCGRLVQ